MKVLLPPKSELTTDRWIEIRVEEATTVPKVWTQGVGWVDVKATKQPGEYLATFMLLNSGDYTLKVIHQQENFETQLHLRQSNQISFSTEMGIFLFCLTLALVGVYHWTKKISATR